jgi:hypothetical protein
MFMDNIPNLSTKDGGFYIEDINSGLSGSQKENMRAKDIEGYQAKILNIGGPMLIPHIHELFNLVVKHGFPKTWTQSLVVPIFKSGDRSNSSTYMTIIISHILAKLYIIILEKKINIWLESHG